MCYNILLGCTGAASSKHTEWGYQRTFKLLFHLRWYYGVQGKIYGNAKWSKVENLTHKKKIGV